ncbi:MAG TPA: hypothetical protein PLP29_09195 [Candidatus Ozemobacteraceae bacterium]|nr:hypothetical protein [Candidatus Ozemobacteraceae bacterium]
MRNNVIAVLTVFAMLFLSLQAFGLAPVSSKALDAFRRYEPDFLNAYYRLQELDRKASNQGLVPKDEGFAAIRDEADDIFEFVQKRYDLLDDLYKGVSGDNPADQGSLMEGFQRIDDLYRKVRDFHHARFVERAAGAAPASSAIETAKTEADAQPDQLVPAASQAADVTAPAKIEAVPTTPVESATTAESETAESKKVAVTGTLKLEARNRNEMYPNTDTAIPNNLSQMRLSLMYERDARNKISLDEKMLQRRRNELVKENILSLGWLHQHSKNTAFTVKDTLHHLWYPDTVTKNYRDNLAEVFWNSKQGKYEYLQNLGWNTRVYPRYSRSDFTQLNYNSQTTYFLPNGTLFYEGTHNWRSYEESPNLDYINSTYYGEFSRSYAGNKSDLSVSNTYDTRHYGNEAVNLYRANYWDNYFRFRYDLPVSKTFSWTFEDEWQKRLYASDDPRGYAQLKLKTTANIFIDKQTKGRFSHQYTGNFENTRSKTHKNHQFAAMWERKFTDTFKLRLEDTFHRRNGLTSDQMDFKENGIVAKASWRLPSKIELTWRNELLERVYAAAVKPDFRYWGSSVVATYARPKKYDWQFETGYRAFSHEKATTGGWNESAQPMVLAKANFVLRDDLKLQLSASHEKTFYKYFDPDAQELLWDFARPVTITDFYAGLVYDF